MTELNTDRTVAINRATKWKRIDEDTPRGVKLQLISKPAGVAQYGIYHAGDKFYTHWFDTPTFDENEE